MQQDIADGDAFLMIRQETVSLVPAGSGLVDARISSIKPMGAHTLATLSITADVSGGPSVRLSAEIVGIPDLSPGDCVGVSFDQSSAWAVNN